MGRSLPVFDEIPTPDWYMPQADESEAEPQKQAMWNCGCSHQSRAARNLGCSHLVEILRRKSTARSSLVSTWTCCPLKLWSGRNSAEEIHSKNFPNLWSFADSEGHSKGKERRISSGHRSPCRDGSVSSGRGYWLLYVLHISKGNISAKLSGTWANAKKYTVRISNQESWRLKMSNPITKNSDN